jgi:hypothetical protein
MAPSGFGGLEVAYWPFVPKFAGSNPAKPSDFSGEKIPQHAFLRRGTKAVCPMSCLRHLKNPKVTWKSPLSAKFLGHFSPIIPPSAVGFASVASDAGGLLWWKLERSKSLVLLQVAGWTCRWQRHSVKPSCWECSTTVEQAGTQLRVVVPIEEEETWHHFVAQFIRCLQFFLKKKQQFHFQALTSASS